MSPRRMKLVICGLSITSSWGNGHATTYRALVRELSLRGHDVLFLEYDKPWYAQNRDLPRLPYGRLGLFGSLEEFKDRFSLDIRDADAVVVGSFVPEGIEIGNWVTSQAKGLPVFYDIDTPVTLSNLWKGREEYLNRELIRKYRLYLSFTGGPILSRIEAYGSPRARPLYCSVDIRDYYPDSHSRKWDLGYLGTYSEDRQRKVEDLLMHPARIRPRMSFVVAGAQYPREIDWHENTKYVEHLAPTQHRVFYNSQRFTLNLTRQDMVVAGYSPSVRLFEAAACGTPIISDAWPGLDEFFEVGKEILVAHSTDDVLRYLDRISPEERAEIGSRARERVLQKHTSAHRAEEFESFILESLADLRSQGWN